MDYLPLGKDEGKRRRRIYKRFTTAEPASDVVIKSGSGEVLNVIAQFYGKH